MNTLKLVRKTSPAGTLWEPLNPIDLTLMRHFIGAELASLNIDGLVTVKDVASIHGIGVEVIEEAPSHVPMSFDQAFQMWREGARIRRSSWHPSKWISPDGDTGPSLQEIEIGDMKATDWVAWAETNTIP